MLSSNCQINIAEFGSIMLSNTFFYTKMHFFNKTFGQSKKKQYLCTRF